MGKRLLVCDDALFIRMIIKEMLLKGGYEIAGEAENGQQAIERYEELKPDLVLMDITMPVMDGITALEKILSTDRSAKIVMVSALGQSGQVEQCIKKGAKDFVVKPVRPERLYETVQKYL